MIAQINIDGELSIDQLNYLILDMKRTSENLGLNINITITDLIQTSNTNIERDYNEPLHIEDDDIEVYSVENWNFMIEQNLIWNDCGSGYWVREGYSSRDEVFSTPQLDATHVVWYSK